MSEKRKSRDEEGYSFDDCGLFWEACGSGQSGRIKLLHQDDGGIRCAVIASPLSLLSGLTQGISGTKAEWLKGGSFNISKTAVMIAINVVMIEVQKQSLMVATETEWELKDLATGEITKYPEHLEQQHKEELSLIAEQLRGYLECLINSYIDLEGGDLHREEIDGNHFPRLMEKFLSDALTEYGGDGLIKAGEVVKSIEKKIKQPEEDQLHLLKCIEEATKRIGDVPTSGEVMALWLAGDKSRNENQFNRKKNQLGFSWLPAAKPWGISV